MSLMVDEDSLYQYSSIVRYACSWSLIITKTVFCQFHSAAAAFVARHMLSCAVLTPGRKCCHCGLQIAVVRCERALRLCAVKAHFAQLLQSGVWW
eukprot:COSAG02_NODE_6418_length_3586_cov_1.351018_2_plen_95_part_00